MKHFCHLHIFIGQTHSQSPPALKISHFIDEPFDTDQVLVSVMKM